MKHFWLLLWLLPTVGRGAEEIPKRAPEAVHYRNLWENSPFQRPLNAAESYVLTGVVRIDGKPVVTMLNKATGERFPLSTEANGHGWRLIDLQNDGDPRNVMATVSINGEEVAVRFNEAQLSSGALQKATEGPGLPVLGTQQGARRSSQNAPRKERPRKERPARKQK